MKRNTKLKLIIACGVVIAVLVGAGAWYYFSQLRPLQTAQEEKSTDDTITDIVDGAVSDGGDLDKGRDELIKMADEADNEEDKEQYLSAASDISLRAGDAQGAIQVAERYERESKSIDSAASLASAYEEANDYESAAKYYALAAERSPKPANATERSPYNDYMLLKEQMEAME